jgi:hypothetical protein
MEYLYLLNNTVYNCASTCIELNDWNGATGEMVCRNNAAYQNSPSSPAFTAPDGIGIGTVDHNKHYGTSAIGVGSTTGNPPILEFADTTTDPGIIDLYPIPISALINHGVNIAAVPTDFEGFARPFGLSTDIGAYEFNGTPSHGWQIDSAFKDIALTIEENRRMPEDVGIIVFPNPFNSSCKISAPVNAEIEIYDISGKRVATPCGADAPLSPLSRGTDTNAKHEGQGVYIWQPSPSVPSGVYLVRAIMGNETAIRRVVYLK